MAKECPKCRLINPPTGERCDCGYNFVSGRMERSGLDPRPPTSGADAAKVMVALLGILSAILSLVAALVRRAD